LEEGGLYEASEEAFFDDGGDECGGEDEDDFAGEWHGLAEGEESGMDGELATVGLQEEGDEFRDEQ